MPRILIADDEWVTRVEIEEMLTDLGYEVVGQAETGAEAIDMVRSLEPDLVIMDVMMPGEMNGIDAAKVIKAESGTPIIFITGYGDPEYIEAAKEIAPFGYVMKPFDEMEVHAFVEIALSKRALELKVKKAHEDLERSNLILQEEMAARKETENALRESEKLYRDIFEKNNAMKWLLDPSSGRIIDANPAACEFYQYSHEEFTNLRLWDVNIKSKSDVKKFLARANLGEKTEFSFQHRLASGEIRDVQIYTGTLESNGKKLLHSIIIDITDRMRAEKALKKAHDELERRVENRTAELAKANKQLKRENEAHKRTVEELRESEKKLNAILDATTETIVLIGKKGIVQMANKTVCDRLTTTKEEIIGKKLYDFFSPQVAEGRRKKWNRVFETGKPVSFEDSRAGMIFEQVAYPILGGGDQVEMVAVFANDKTDRVQAEQALRESERHRKSLMESASNFAVYRLISDGDNPNLLKVVLVSPSITDIMGVSEPMSFETWFKHLHPDDVERIVSANIEAFKTLRFNETMRVYHPQKQKWVWIHAVSTGFEGQEQQTYVNGILIDITREKEAEEGLRESEERYRTVLESNPDPVVVYDMEGRVIYLNPAFTRVFGWFLEEKIGKRIDDFVPEKNWPETRMMINKVTTSGESFSGIETRRYTKEGNILDVSISCSCYRDHEGNVAASVINLRDITEQKLAEEALQESENKYRNLVEESFDGIFIQKSSNIIFVNKRLEEMLGYEKGELIGQNHWVVYHPDYQELTRGRAQTRMRGEAVEPRYEVKLQRKDGSWFYGEINARTITFPSSEERGIQVWIKDIDERKRDERKLKNNERFLQTLIDAIPAPVFYKDREGKYLGFNKAFETFFGEPNEQIIGKTVFDINPPELAKIHHAKDQELLKSGGLQRYESRWQGAHGKLRDFIYNKAVFCDSKGNTIGLIGVRIDITERKQAEEEKRRLETQIQQSQKMESIGNLAGGIAHDFNNILSSVIGYTELALDEVEKGTRIENSLQEVYVAGKRATDLVKQILAFARKSDVEFRPIRIDTIVKEVLKFIRASIPTTIEIKQSIETDSLVMGNATQVHQVLMNLCTNSAHAMEKEGGILEVTLKDIAIDNSMNRKILDLEPGNYIEIKVSDTGLGIAPEIIGSIFEPYFTTKGPGEGTGLGLSVVHGIIESCGGEITVDSKLGEGTTFAIYLPITGERRAHRPYASEALPFGTERILFVDDEASLSKMGSQILESLGYSVTARINSFEALELFKTMPDKFDLVITDTTMPNITGDKLAVELMKIRPDIPVILCTGYSKRISDQTASEIGIKAFAYKPVVKADLAKTVRKVLDEAQNTSQA